MMRTIRGTQTLVDQMGWVAHRPLLVTLEIAWRWLFGAPLVLLCWNETHAILAAVPVLSTPLANFDTKNPWQAASQIAEAWTLYEPRVLAVLIWLVPAAALAWCVISGYGRALLLARMEPDVLFRPLAMAALQAAWLLLWCAVVGAWFSSMRGVVAAHIAVSGEPDLIGLSIWAIFLSLGFFTLWALVSWPLAVAPVLLAGEQRNVFSALGASLHPGCILAGKLVETNLVMGIVKLALLVLAMVFSAAPLPFSDQLGADAMRVVWLGAVLFYLIASDYFHVVRLKAYFEFWRAFQAGEANRTAQEQIKRNFTAS